MKYWGNGDGGGRSMLFLLCASLCLPLPAHADYYILGQGKKQPFCEKIVKTLNRTKPWWHGWPINEPLGELLSKPGHKPLGKMPCTFDLIMGMPGVSDPPWEKIDYMQHEWLAVELLIKSSMGEHRYLREYASEHKTRPEDWMTEEQKQQVAQRFRRLGAEMFIWHPPPADPGSGEDIFKDTVYLTVRLKNELCGEPARPGGEESYWGWVASDLRGFAKLPYSVSSDGRPLRYRGQLYFLIANDSDILLHRFNPDFGIGPPFCVISFRANPPGRAGGKINTR